MLQCSAYDLPRHVVARWVNRTLGLDGQVQKTSDSDAGTLVIDHFDPIALWRVRYMLGDLISTKAPPYKRALTTIESPETDLNALPPLGYVKNGPVLKSHRPICDTFHPR